MTWSGIDSVETKRLRNKARLEDGQCLYCKPHRGENHGRRHGKYLDGGTFRPSKDKRRK
jgi:hypothetical protein